MKNLTLILSMFFLSSASAESMDFNFKCLFSSFGSDVRLEKESRCVSTDPSNPSVYGCIGKFTQEIEGNAFEVVLIQYGTATKPGLWIYALKEGSKVGTFSFTTNPMILDSVLDSEDGLKVVISDNKDYGYEVVCRRSAAI